MFPGRKIGSGGGDFQKVKNGHKFSGDTGYLQGKCCFPPSIILSKCKLCTSNTAVSIILQDLSSREPTSSPGLHRKFRDSTIKTSREKKMINGIQCVFFVL